GLHSHSCEDLGERIRGTGDSGGNLSATSSLDSIPQEAAGGQGERMPRLKLSLACWNYDRTRALMDGSVRPDGIDLTYLNLPVEETFFRMLRPREFDAAEMSLSSYTVSMFHEPQPFIAIPVFPSRFFRHSCIYINTKAGIRQPKD